MGCTHVVRDSLRVSDADDLSQLTTVECMTRCVGVNPHVPELYMSTVTINTMYSFSRMSWDTR